MSNAVSLSPGSAAPLWLSTALLSILGSAMALRGAGEHPAQPALEAATGLAMDARVDVVIGASPAAPLREAALRLGLAWRDFGVEARVVESASGQLLEDAAPVAVVVELLPEEPEEMEALGLRVRGTTVEAPDGRTWPRDAVAVALTATGGKRALTTRVLAGSQHQAPTLRALEVLATVPPPRGPRWVLWAHGERVFEAPVDANGRVMAAQGRSYAGRTATGSRAQDPADPAHPDEPKRRADLLRRAAGAAKAVAAASGQSGDPQPGDPQSGELVPTGVRFVDSLGVRSREGSVQRTGWYDAGANTFVLLRGATSAADDALHAFVEARLAVAFGPAAMPWFARGIAYGLTGRCGGFTLTEIESRTGSVTPEEILGEATARTRLTAAPAEARLARCLLVALKSDVRAAWSVDVSGDAELASRLKTTWQASLDQSPIEPRLAPPRSLKKGVVVEVELSNQTFDDPAFHGDLERIAGLGFAGVQFMVHVAVPPPSFAERRERAVDQRQWGSSVTVEGDGSVIEAALLAKELGLSVVLAPQFVASASGSLGRKQIHGSAERVQTYGDRRAIAMEGVSWLCEQGRIDGLVMFDPEDLPRADANALPAHPPELVAAYRSTRRQSLVYSQPFAGDRLAFSRSLAGVESAHAEDTTAGFGGPLAVVRLKLGLEMDLATSVALNARAQQLKATVEMTDGDLWALRVHGLAASDVADLWAMKAGLDGMELPGPRFWLASRWSLAGTGHDVVNLRDLSDEVLRSMAARTSRR